MPVNHQLLYDKNSTKQFIHLYYPQLHNKTPLKVMWKKLYEPKYNKTETMAERTAKLKKKNKQKKDRNKVRRTTTWRRKEEEAKIPEKADF